MHNVSHCGETSGTSAQRMQGLFGCALHGGASAAKTDNLEPGTPHWAGMQQQCRVLTSTSACGT